MGVRLGKAHMNVKLVSVCNRILYYTNCTSINVEQTRFKIQESSILEELINRDGWIISAYYL